MARKVLGSSVPEVKGPAYDIEALKADLVAKANAQVPAELRGLTPDECRARMRQMGGFANAVRMREPGEDENETKDE